MSRKSNKPQGNEAEPTESAEPPSPITLIREIQSQALDPSALSAESRRACVEHLTAEGCSAAEISEIFKVSLRTVFRDLADIRRAHAIERDPSLAEEFVGELVLQARQTVARLRRLARDRDCPHPSRVEAEGNAWTVLRELTETLQRLGFLPTAAQEIRADLTHRVEAPAGLEELQRQFDTLECVLREVEGADAARARLAPIQADLARSSASEKIRLLGQAVSAPSPVTEVSKEQMPDASAPQA